LHAHLPGSDRATGCVRWGGVRRPEPGVS